MVEQLISLAHVFLAAILGGIVGLERESKDKPAGFRTNMIIASACALLVILGEIVVEQFIVNHEVPEKFIETDPVRIIQAIVIGVSFIGAGSILKSNEKQDILFLTTAATILLSATIGIAIALKMYTLGVGITLLVLLINRIVKIIFEKIDSKK
jgi:putative Mg2+ transporter-C (MgtC) family protein